MTTYVALTYEDDESEVVFGTFDTEQEAIAEGRRQVDAGLDPLRLVIRCDRSRPGGDA